MKLVYIASPFAGDIEKNIEAARQYCRIAVEQGVTPVAPHLLYPQFLDDGDLAQRNMGMQAGLELLSRCDEFWVCGPEISPGMQKELQFAQGLGMPVRRMEHLPQQIKEQEPVAVRYLSAHPGVSEKDCCQEDGVWHIPSDYPDAEPDNFEMEVGMC